mgnify:CR=1 FL=1
MKMGPAPRRLTPTRAAGPSVRLLRVCSYTNRPRNRGRSPVLSSQRIRPESFCPTYRRRPYILGTSETNERKRANAALA